jgi:hypothetical protein
MTEESLNLNETKEKSAFSMGDHSDFIARELDQVNRELLDVSLDIPDGEVSGLEEVYDAMIRDLKIENK